MENSEKIELLQNEINRYEGILETLEDDVERMELLDEDEYKIKFNKETIECCKDKIERFKAKLVALEGNNHLLWK